ncbi:MAG: dihydrolipoyl dehydrogenase [Sedimenticola sp.]
MSKQIAIIGGGPGGYVAAIRAAQLGAQVHLIEKNALGGTCLNVGCIPTKALLHVAEAYQTLLKGESIGIKADNVRLDWPAAMDYQKALVKRLVKGVDGLLKANKVQVHRGHAQLKSINQIEIDGTCIDTDAIILAVGSEPTRIPFPGADLEGIIDSTAALNLKSVPDSMVVIGGGVIGVEFAAMYNSFGTKVTIVEMLPQILPGIDSEIVSLVHDDLVQKGIKIITAARLEEVRKQGSDLLVLVDQGGGKNELPADKVLVAVGRRPRTGGMGLEEIGVIMDRGRVQVDANFLTNIPNVYAVGDCSSLMMLAHVASAQGVAAVEHALGHNPAYFGHIVPACIYTHPEIATVGLSEEQAQAKGVDFRSGVFSLSGNSKALIESEGKGIIKIISGAKYGEILGVHIWGPRATDLIAEAALAMRLEATVDELISTIHAHPTVGEAMPEAALDTDGMAIHWPPGLKKAN